MGRASLAMVESGLRTFRLPYTIIGGAATRGASTFNPRGGVAHHTAGPAGGGDMPSLNTIVNGRTGLRGPLANFGLGRSGHVYVVAMGTANHAGVGNWLGLTGNSSVWGIEAENNGYQAWPLAQLDAYYRLAASLAMISRFSAGMWSMHREWAKPAGRKPDPHSIDGPRFRGCVTLHLASVAPKPPTPPTPTPVPPTPTPSTRLESGVLRLIKNPYAPTQVWITDGFAKRYISTGEELNFYAYQIALDLPTDTREAGKVPQTIPTQAFDQLQG